MSQRTIVITGASDGIGAAAARALSKAGERVVVVGRSGEKTQAVAKELDADYFVSDFAQRALAKANNQAYDADLARELWESSEEMVSGPSVG